MRALITSLAVAIAALPAQAQEARPNVLLIIADDMGRDALSCYDVGEARAPMPVVEAMCERGLVFDNAYAYPVCSPTRASILTGRYASETGIGGPVPYRMSGAGLDEGFESVFDALAATGYATGLIGKWHLAAEDDGFDHPAAFGVLDYYGFYTGGAEDYFTWSGVEGGAQIPVEGYMTTVFTDRAADWIAAQDAPWFLWLAYTAPHAPFHTPPEHLHSFGDIADGDTATQYKAMLEAMDTEIGRLLDSMNPAMRENTVVIFVGDNGTPNQVARDLYAPRTAKGSLYEGGIHVPMVVTGPVTEPGRTDAFASVTDLRATIGALAGAPTGPPSSHDLTPVLAGGDSPREVIFVERFGASAPRGQARFGWTIRIGDDKLIAFDDGGQELYDLAADPMERVDLLADGVTEGEAALVAALSVEHDARTEGTNDDL